MRNTVLFFLFFLLGGCATSRAVDEHVDYDIQDKLTVYRDQWVHRSPPEVHVEPAGQANYAPKVLFIPFRVTQNIENPGMVGYSVARVVWQTWLSMRLFPAMEFTGDDTPYRRDRAVQLGRQRGADVVVGGFVTYFYPGGTAGDTQLAIQLEAYDVGSGQLVWSFAQSGIMPAAKTRDYFIFATKTRLPSDPVQAVAKALAGDMGTLIQNWMSQPPPASRLKKLDQDTKQILFAPKDPVPAPRPME